MSTEHILQFEHKSVVVTGAGAGMGKQITLDFLKAGATVVAVEINAATLKAYQAELKQNWFLVFFHLWEMFLSRKPMKK